MGRKDVGDRFSDALDVRLRGGRLTVRESLNKFDRLDFYRVRLTGRSNFSCLLDGLEGNADLTLFDSSGREITSSEEDDDDSEGISRQLGGGIYFVRINRIEGNTDYRLRFSITQDAGDSFKESFRIRSGKLKAKGKFDFRDAIGEDDDDFDYYRFDLDSRSTCTTLLQGLSANADIELFDSSRKRIAVSSNGGISSELINQVLEAGSYFIKVKVKVQSSVTQYKLRLSFTSLTIDLGDDDVSTAQPIIIGSSDTLFDNFVGTADPEDFYKVDLTSPSNLNLALSGLSADANLELINSNGTVLGSSVNPGTADDLLNLNLAAGRYFVRVFPATTNISTAYKLDFAVSPLQLFGLTNVNNSLLAFNADAPNKAVSIGITGLATGETLRSIDFRPATGKLYGLSSSSKLYTIDLATGIATALSPTPIAPALTGTAVGMDFNPVVDRLRVVSDTDENLRLNPDTGLLSATDTVLAYGTTDVNAAANPNVTAAAYTNNFFASLSTTLYGIDTTLDRLVRQGDLGGVPTSPNAGTLTTVGALGVDFGPNAAFDIFTDRIGINTAYATNGTTLYRVNLDTGVVTSLGTITAPPLPNTVTTTVVNNVIGLATRV